VFIKNKSGAEVLFTVVFDDDGVTTELASYNLLDNSEMAVFKA